MQAFSFISSPGDDGWNDSEVLKEMDFQLIKWPNGPSVEKWVY